MEGDEGVVGRGGGFEGESLGVEAFEGFEDPGDLGAAGPAGDLRDRELVELAELGDGVVAGEPVVDEAAVCVGDLEVVGIGWDEGLGGGRGGAHGPSLAYVWLDSRRKEVWTLSLRTDPVRKQKKVNGG